MKHIVLFIGSILLTTACSGKIEDASLGNNGQASSVGGSSSFEMTTASTSVVTGGSSSMQGTPVSLNTGGSFVGLAGGSSPTGGASTTRGSSAISATGGANPSSCFLEKTEALPMYTSSRSIQAGTNGFFVLGLGVDASNNPDAMLARFQYWNLSTKVMEHEFYATPDSWLIKGGGSAEGFLLVNGGPSTHGNYLAPSIFDANGMYQKSENLGWRVPSTQTNPLGTPYSTPMHEDTIVVVSGGSKRQLLWRRRNTEADPYTLMSNVIASDHFEQAEMQYTWSDLGNLYPDAFIAAATPSDNMLAATSMSCDVVPVEGCPDYGWDLMFWDSKLPVAQRVVKIIHTNGDLNGHVSNIFPFADGFDVQIGRRIVRYSPEGIEGRSFDLPTNASRITRFRDGYAIMTASQDNLKDFQLLRTTIDGSVVETVPFSSEFDRYDMAIGNLAAVGNDSLVFTWSGLESGKSTLAFFACR